MVNTLIILDRQKRVIDSLSNNGDNPISPFYDDMWVQLMTSGGESYTFTVPINDRTNESVVEGNYVAFKVGTKVKLFQIMEVSDIDDKFLYKQVYAETAGLELYNNVFRPRDLTTVNAKQFIQTALEGTQWQVGMVDMALNRVISINVKDYIEVYKLIQDYITDFGMEIEFRVEMNGNRVVGQYIDLHVKRGKETKKRFEYGVNVSQMRRTISTDNLATRLIGVGKDGLTFKEVEWLSDKPALKPKNQDFIEDVGATAIWNDNGKPITHIFKVPECESPDELLLLTWNKLQEIKTPKFTYETATEMIEGDEEEIEIGDTVDVIDHNYNPSILLSARVGQLNISFTDHTKNSCVLTNFKEVKSGIMSAEDIQAMIEGKFPITGDNIADKTITDGNIMNGTITGLLIKADAIQAKHIEANQIETKHLTAGCITAEKAIIADAAIKTAQIGDAQITSAKIANGAIDNVHIEDATINGAKIQDATIGTLQVADAAITNAKIGNLAVDNAKIKDLSADKITAGQIAADRITANVIEAINASIGKITADHIDVESLVVDNIDAGKITTGTLDAERITSSVITAINASIENATINSAKIGNLSADKITTGTLSADVIKGNVITAINASLESAKIDQAHIGDLNANKITSGFISSDRIEAGSINATKISADAISAISINASEVVAGKIAAGDIKVGNANILDGTINGAKIEKATITNAQMSTAFIADGYIKNLNADKITSGSLNTTKVNMSSTSGQLSIADNTIQIKDNQATPKVRVQIGKDKLNNYGILVMNANGEAIFDSDKGVLSPNGLDNNVITGDKIRDEEIGPSKLQIDEIWASEGFIGNFKAQEIDAARLINVEAIDTSRLDITGVVSFNSLSTDMKGSFTQSGGKTFIDGGNILTQTLTGEQINTRGFKASDSAGNTTFNIDKDTGKVSMSGLVESIGFSDVEGQYRGYQLDPQGKATLNDAILRGSVILPQAGITNADNTGERKVRFWAGAEYDNRTEAPFIVYSDGKIKATEGEFGGTFTGKLSIGNIHIEDTNNSEGAIEVKTKDDLETRIHLSENSSYINSNLAIGSKFVNFDTTNFIVGIGGKTIFENGSNSTTMNDGSSVIKTSDGIGKHNTYYDKGILTHNSYGSQTGADFTFERNEGTEPVVVEVEGELKARDKITMNNNIAIVSNQDVGNSGFDFVVK